MAQREAIELEYIGREYLRPPMVHVRVDVALYNDHEQARWFVFPAGINPTASPTRESISVAEVHMLVGRGRVAVCHLFGNANYYALLAPPGAEITIHDLKISLWEEDRIEVLDITAMIAASLLIDGEDAPTWLELDVMCDRQAKVDFEEKERIVSKYSPELAERPLSIAGEKHDIQLHIP